MLSDLLAAFKGCDKVIFKLTGCGEQECETAEFKGAIEAIEALQAENEQLQAQVARMWEALRKAREAIRAAWSDGSANAAMDKACEALAEIGKALGGKEDV